MNKIGNRYEISNFSGEKEKRVNLIKKVFHKEKKNHYKLLINSIL